MKILAAHQPNYQPWLGLFHKVAQADVWVLADDVQYSSPGFTNRNRIRTQEGWMWLTVPVRTRGKGLQQICDVELVDESWQRKHWEAIRHSYHDADFFEEQAVFLEDFYTARVWTRLLDVNVALIRWVLEQLGIDVEIQFSSALQLRQERTERLVDMVVESGCQAYLAGDGGSRSYLRTECFDDAGIELMFCEFQHPVYSQCQGGFEAHMSAVDLLMNCGAQGARKVMGLAQD